MQLSENWREWPAPAKAALLRRLRDRPAQITDAAIDWQPQPGPQRAAFDTPAFETLYGGAAGGGKALAMNTPVLATTGWKTMDTLLPGDYVFGADGLPTAVVAVSDVLLDRECYRLTFDNGESLVADAEHEWLTFSGADLAALTRRDGKWRARRRARRPSRVLGNKSPAFVAAITKRNQQVTPETIAAPTGTVKTTKDLLSAERSHAIPVAECLQWEQRGLLVDPYLLGVWLGDGTSAVGSFTTADSEIVQAFADGGFVPSKQSGAYAWGTHGFTTRLRRLGVLRNKHVPDDYLFADQSQRLALLQGLMDTDGTANKGGSVEFTSTKRCLADAVSHLANSLGHKSHVREGRARLNGKDISPNYRVKWTAPDVVFRLPHKVAKQKTTELRRTGRFHYVTECSPCDSVPVRCIQVAAKDGLFLVGKGLIPTHNSDLLLGLARLAHRSALLLRRTYPELEDSLIVRSRQFYGDERYYNASLHVWRLPGHRVRFGHLERDNDVHQYQSAQFDLIGFDELTQFTRTQYEYLLSRARSTIRAQRVRVVACTNPGGEGNDWVMERWAAWLDPGHRNPAQPGEIRYYKRADDGAEIETTADDPDGISRTFIAARLSDNAYLDENYRRVLAAMPEPYRSQLLSGDWQVGMVDDAYQVIPTAWIKAAMARWTADGGAEPLTTLGVDVARGGDDQTVLAPRHGDWIGLLEKHPGRVTPDGQSVAALIAARLSSGRAHIDVIGWGSSAYDISRMQGLSVAGINFSEGSKAHDKSGRLSFVNLRAEAYWTFREKLDPTNDAPLALPNDPEMAADLRAPRWSMQTNGIKIESKDDIKKRIKRSPDCGDAVVLAVMPGPPDAAGLVAFL